MSGSEPELPRVRLLPEEVPGAKKRNPEPQHADQPMSPVIPHSSFGDHTRIHQGNVYMTIGDAEASSFLTTSLAEALTPFAGGNRQSTCDWLNDVFRDDGLWWTDQDVFDCNSCHLSDEGLNGFIQTHTMDLWHSSQSAVLWCRLNIGESLRGHCYPAACILRQVLGEHAAGTEWVAFSYNHNGVEQVNPCLPRVPGSGKFVGVEEVILLSLLLQARRKGFPVHLQGVDFRKPEIFKDTLVSVFVETLRNISGRVFFIIENLNNKLGRAFELILRVTVALRSARTDRGVKIIISAGEVPEAVEALRKYPFVMSDSEYRECLQSLCFSDRNIRRDEIADPVRSSNLWIWNHPAIRMLMSNSAGTVAIIGKAGSGKSVLAKTIQQGVSRHWSRVKLGFPPLLVGDWFYCRRRGDVYTSYDSLLRSILSEFLIKDKSLFQHYKAESRQKRSIGTSGSWETSELERILVKLNRSDTPLFMVFDGIDEANDDKMVGLIEDLVQDPNSSIRAIFLSRPKEEFEAAYWRGRTTSFKTKTTPIS